MQEKTIRYLLDTLPKIRKLFMLEEKDLVSHDTMVLAAILVDQCQRVLDQIEPRTVEGRQKVLETEIKNLYYELQTLRDENKKLMEDLRTERGE